MLSRLASVQSFWIKNANFKIRGVRLSIEETLFIATRNILKRNIRVGGKFFWKKMFLYTWFHGFAALNSHSNTVISKKKERNYRNSPFRTRLMKQNFSKAPSNFIGKKCYSNDHVFIYIFFGYSVTMKKVKKKSCMHFALCDTWREAQWWGVIMGILCDITFDKVTWQLSARNKRDRQVSQIPTKVDEKDSRWVEIYFTCSLKRF